MNQHGDSESKELILEQITQYCAQSSGLRLVIAMDHSCRISQKFDGKAIPLNVDELEEVITRYDSDGKLFLQVNYLSGNKILLTDQLIGFRPSIPAGFDVSKLPKVVTTPDVMSIVEAMQEVMTGDSGQTLEELDVLKKVFFAVIEGGESVGFDLSSERNWINRLHSSHVKAKA